MEKRRMDNDSTWNLSIYLNGYINSFWYDGVEEIKEWYFFGGDEQQQSITDVSAVDAVLSQSKDEDRKSKNYLEVREERELEF